MPADRPLQRLTIKAALLLGFGLTFGIWLVAGYYFTRRVSEAENRAAAINTRFMQAQERLSTVRAQVLLGSVYVRDALLDPNPETDEYRRQIQITYDAVDQALQQYVPVLDSSAERERVASLQHEIDDFRETMLRVLDSEGGKTAAQARELLRTQIVPKRETVIRVSEEVQALNQSAFVDEQREITGIYSASQRRLWASLGLALAASFGIAAIAALYAGRLESRLRTQRLRDAQNTSELQRLSAKLITAQEEERRSIARELHDEVGQVLTAVKVELALAQRAAEAGGGAAHLLDDARSLTEGALTTVRDLSQILHPALLDDLGLTAAVQWYLGGFAKRFGLHTEVLDSGMDRRLAPEVEASAYRIIQEALTNVAKHAQATICRVYLQRLPNTLLVTVEDNGAGFDGAVLNASVPRPGLGLVSIRERAAELRGTVRLESAPGKGTRLTVELPARPRLSADEAPPPEVQSAMLGQPERRAADG